MNRIMLKRARIVQIINRFQFVAFIEDLDKEVDVSVSKKLKAYNEKTLDIDDFILVEISPYDLERGRLHRDTFLINKSR